MQPFILAIDPAVADITGKNLMSKSTEFCVFSSGPHVVEVLKTSVFRNKIWVEWLEQDPAWNLGSDQIAKPGRAAPGCAGNQNTFAQVRAGVDVKTATNFLKSTPV